jgi:hypothetical protein
MSFVLRTMRGLQHISGQGEREIAVAPAQASSAAEASFAVARHAIAAKQKGRHDAGLFLI